VTDKSSAQLSPLALITIGDKHFRQRWFTESEVRTMLAEQRKKTIDAFTLNLSQVGLLKEIGRLQEFAQRMVTEKWDAIAEARTKARADLIAEMKPVAHWIPSAKTFAATDKPPGKAWVALAEIPKA